MGLTEETFPTILRAVGQQEKLTLMRTVDLTVYVQLLSTHMPASWSIAWGVKT